MRRASERAVVLTVGTVRLTRKDDRADAGRDHDSGSLFAHACQMVQAFQQGFGFLAAVMDVLHRLLQIALHFRVGGQALETAGDGVQFVGGSLQIGDGSAARFCVTPPFSGLHWSGP